ncbi:MAG: cell division protein FtsZ [Candidatus Liptonbacteria bacterium]|nr:cell division protein FtsZ [Candidatus Liptonbacteria bacterium]
MAKKRKIQKPARKENASRNQIASIKVVGIGGGGGNAVSRMSENFIKGVEFIAINTDHQDLDHAIVKQKIYIGKNLTRGLGSGMNPDLGRQAAEENRSEIAETLKGADIVFLTAGFGGGTGTGATPIVAEVAKQSGALTVAVVTKPFAFEGTQRSKIAMEGLAKLRDKVDALIVVPNDRIFSIISKDTPVLKAFEAIDEVLRNALSGIVELIVTPGIINVDFADVKAIMQDSGSALVGVSIATGQDRAVKAVNEALRSPLLEVTAEGAKGVILGISGSRDLKMAEINEAAKLVAQAADPSARIIFGAYYDRNLRENQIKITLIAAGFNGTSSANSLFGATLGEKQFFSPNKFEKLEKTGDPSDAREFAGQSPSVQKSSQPEAKKQEKSEDDVWDIPTFLRKRKK